MKKFYIVIVVLFLVIILILLKGLFFSQPSLDEFKPGEICRVDCEQYGLEYGDFYVEPDDSDIYFPEPEDESKNGSEDKVKDGSEDKVNDESKDEDEEANEVKDENSDEIPVITMKTSATVKLNDNSSNLNKEDIIELLEVNVTDKEDGTIEPDNIIVEPEIIRPEEEGENTVTISYVDNDGNEVEKSGTIEISKEGNSKPEIKYSTKKYFSPDGIIVIKEDEVPEDYHDFINMLDIRVVDDEDGEVILKEENFVLNRDKKTIEVRYFDSGGKEAAQVFEYKIVSNSYSLFVTLFLGISLLLVIGIIFILFKIINLMKKN